MPAPKKRGARKARTVRVPDIAATPKQILDEIYQKVPHYQPLVRIAVIAGEIETMAASAELTPPERLSMMNAAVNAHGSVARYLYAALKSVDMKSAGNPLRLTLDMRPVDAPEKLDELV